MQENEYSPIPLVPKEFWEDEDWAYDNYNELVRKYPDQWVSIVEKHVIAAGDNRAKVIELAKRKAGKKDFPTIFLEKKIRVYKNQCEIAIWLNPEGVLYL
jgi:hypothetical protein